jgi:gamma-glutamylcysteine synthetase
MIEDAVGHFLARFEEVEEKRKLKSRSRRIGSELKFPLVTPDGRAADSSKTRALWEFLARRGWRPLEDPHSKAVIGATSQGEMNEHRASCETGFCKVEFSLAHTDGLFSLSRDIETLGGLLGEFSEEHEVAFLGFGLQPVTPPGKHLLMSSKSRNLFWDRLFGGNNHIPPEDGTDVHLFTINASNQVHIDVTVNEAVDAINVFNGLAGAQIALTANSNIWRGKVDGDYKCLGEIFWDWWLKEGHAGRYGVPGRKYHDLDDYFHCILGFPPVYVRRDGVPVGLPHCPTFSDFYSCDYTGTRCGRPERVCGLSADGMDTEVYREPYDLDQHFTFFWHNARLSRYYTLENRVNDQQPPAEMMVVPAFTLGIMEALGDAVELIDGYQWELLKESRVEAARKGLDAGPEVLELSRSALEIAEAGLRKRGAGEEVFLEPLKERLKRRSCPADRAAEVFRAGGPEALVEALRVR